MKTAVCTPEGTVKLTDFDIPKIGPGEVLVRLLACGICGTDVRKIAPGKLGRPVVLGHEVVGEVIESQAPERFKVGDRLATSHHVPCFKCHYCRHENFSMCPAFKTSGLDPGGFSEFLRIPKVHVETIAQKVPPSVNSEEALFMEPIACCLRALKRSRVLKGDVVLVTGLGSVGLLFGLLLEKWGAVPVGLDPQGKRAQLALDFGFHSTYTVWNEKTSRETRHITEGRGFDSGLVSAGTPDLIPTLTESLRDGGTLCIFGGADDNAMLNIPWNNLYRRELTVTSSYSPSPRELSEAFHLICEGLLKKRNLPIKKYPLEQISQAVQDIKNLSVLKAAITP